MQAVGLRYTSASRSAFLLYLNVKLVPVLAGAAPLPPLPPVLTGRVSSLLPY